MMMAMGSKLLRRSLGMPLSVIVAHMEVKLESICRYASQKIGIQKKTLQAPRPRATSSTQASSKLYHLGALAPRYEGLTFSHMVPSFQFLQV